MPSARLLRRTIALAVPTMAALLATVPPAGAMLACPQDIFARTVAVESQSEGFAEDCLGAGVPEVRCPQFHLMAMEADAATGGRSGVDSEDAVARCLGPIDAQPLLDAARDLALGAVDLALRTALGLAAEGERIGREVAQQALDEVARAQAEADRQRAEAERQAMEAKAHAEREAEAGKAEAERAVGEAAGTVIGAAGDAVDQLDRGVCREVEDVPWATDPIEREDRGADTTVGPTTIHEPSYRISVKPGNVTVCLVARLPEFHP